MIVRSSSWLALNSLDYKAKTWIKDNMTKRKINAKAVARDVHAGMGDILLMKKYQLSAKQLEGVLRRLVEADLISHLQLYERTSLSDTQMARAFVEANQAIRELN